MNTKIRFDRVSKVYHIRAKSAQSEDRIFTVLDSVILDVRRGEFLTIVGPSGCGKSTLLDLLAGLTTPSSGQILVDGRPISGPASDRGVVFQNYALFPWRTVQANVEFGLENKHLGAKQRREVARAYLDLVGLVGFEDRYPHQLSGGMKQRVAIARSLACDPEVLMMDEPFAAVDAQTRESLQNELLRIWHKTQKTILFVTHGIDEAIVLGERVAVMTNRPGRIKHLVSVPTALRGGSEDSRSLPLFGEVRHHVASLLRQVVIGSVA